MSALVVIVVPLTDSVLTIDPSAIEILNHLFCQYQEPHVVDLAMLHEHRWGE